MELYFFGLSQRVSGEIFRKGLTKSRRLSDLNVFSGHISEGWQGFLQRINQKPKAVWFQRFFGAHLRTLERLFAQYRSKAEGCLELYFFGVHFQRLEWLFAEDLPKAGGGLA